MDKPPELAHIRKKARKTEASGLNRDRLHDREKG